MRSGGTNCAIMFVVQFTRTEYSSASESNASGRSRGAIVDDRGEVWHYCDVASTRWIEGARARTAGIAEPSLRVKGS